MIIQLLDLLCNYSSATEIIAVDLKTGKKSVVSHFCPRHRYLDPVYKFYDEKLKQPVVNFVDSIRGNQQGP